MVARILVLLAVICTSVASWAFDADRVCTLENGRKVRIDDSLCRPVAGQGSPAPSASPTPNPTVSPLPCEPIGTKTFQVGEERRLCFTAKADRSPFVELSTVNHGNASCADLYLQMFSPTGAASEPSFTSQPGAIMARVPGQYVVVVKLRSANNVACSTFTFIAR